MKRWYNRKPETMQDWLLLFAVAAERKSTRLNSSH